MLMAALARSLAMMWSQRRRHSGFGNGRVWTALNRDSGTMTVGFAAQDAHSQSETQQITLNTPQLADYAQPMIAAKMRDGHACQHFNRKIEAPTIYASAEANDNAVLARWDFSQGIFVEKCSKGFQCLCCPSTSN